MKLTAEDKQTIRDLHKADPKGWNISALSREYKVTRQYIQFIVYPERQARNYQLYKKRKAKQDGSK